MENLRHKSSTSTINILIMEGQAWQTLSKYLLHRIVFHHFNKQPKGAHFTGMIEKGGSNEVHALDIPNKGFVLSICNQNSNECMLYFSFSKVLICLECAFYISLDLAV